MHNLPCYPCPHKGACCAYGASLTVSEAQAVTGEFGVLSVIETGDPVDPLRTRVLEGRCSLQNEDGTCKIHARSYYPKTCKGFPWVDDEGNPYVHDKTICPEFVQITEASNT